MNFAERAHKNEHVHGRRPILASQLSVLLVQKTNKWDFITIYQRLNGIIRLKTNEVSFFFQDKRKWWPSSSGSHIFQLHARTSREAFVVQEVLEVKSGAHIANIEL